MRLVLICVGLLFLLGACSYAQNSAAERSAATQAQDQTAEPSSGKDTDKESSEHHTHVRLGGIAVSAGYTHFSPGFYPNIFPYDPFYYPFTAATWWDPFWGFYPPFPAGYFSQGNGKGELKLSGVPKNASVYVNGGYAGTADHLKSFWLDPGVYDLEVSVPGGRRYEQRVYVLTGKTLHIDAKPKLMTKEGEQL
jgi:PEGA domain